MRQPIRDGVRRLFRLQLRRAEAIHADMDDELRFHIEERVADFVARGMTPNDARAEAMRRLGVSFDHTRNQLHRSADRREHTLAMREWIEDLLHDVRYAARGLSQRPGFTIVAVLTLAIGIGANTAIFSAVDALLLRSLPFRDPATLVDIVQRTPNDPANGGVGDMPWSYPKFITFRNAQQSFEKLALDVRGNFILTGENPERIEGEFVSAQYLATLGASVALGRDFPGEIDAHPDAAKLVIISNALWQRRFHADPRVIGQLLRVDSVSYQVVGVLPSAFHGLGGRADILIPLTTQDTEALGAWDFEFTMIGRLKPGVTVAQADADAKRVAPLVYEATPQDKNTISSGPAGPWGASAHSLNTVRVASTLRRSLLVLFGAVATLLLIACVNLANLLLGRAATRRQEIAIRLAIGAGRARVIRLLLAESLMLATLGGMAGVALAAWGTHLLRTLNPEATLQVQGLGSTIGAVGFEGVHLDGRALAFTFLVTMIVGVLFGLLPALHATRADLTESLKDGQSGAGGGRRFGDTRRLLVVAEVALALVLLAGSGLMLRSLGNVLAVDQGFAADHQLTMRLAIPPGGVPRDSMPGFYEEVQARLAAVPGVERVSLIDCPPLSGGCNGTLMTFPDRPAAPTGNAIVGAHWVTPGWFASVHVPLKRGRMFDAGDRIGGQKVVLINESAARKYWPQEDPLGKTVKVYQGGFHTGATVIGIVGDVRYGTIDSLPAPDVYIAYSQAYTPRMMIFLRTTTEPGSVAGVARRVLHDAFPASPVYDIATMADRVGAASSQARFSAMLLAMFAAVALALAVMGIYGVISFGIVQRTREIGIRMALGADRGRVVRLIVREGAAMVAVGCVLGLGGALAVTRVLRSLLFEVSPTDPATFLVIVSVAVTAALLASWLPARRAARIEPTEALRRG